MAVTNHASGTQSATVGTEHFLTSPNVEGTFVLEVDRSAMVAGDVLELRVYAMMLAGGTSRVAHVARFEGVPPDDDMVAISVPVSNNNELTDANATRFSLKQTKGTSRNFPWKVMKHV